MTSESFHTIVLFYCHECIYQCEAERTHILDLQLLFQTHPSKKIYTFPFFPTNKPWWMIGMARMSPKKKSLCPSTTFWSCCCLDRQLVSLAPIPLLQDTTAPWWPSLVVRPHLLSWIQLMFQPAHVITPLHPAMSLSISVSVPLSNSDDSSSLTPQM